MPSAVIYRMVLPDHECPYGRRAKQMLDDNGFEVDEHILSTRAEVDAFKAEHGVSTTPLIFPWSILTNIILAGTRSASTSHPSHSSAASAPTSFATVGATSR